MTPEWENEWEELKDRLVYDLSQGFIDEETRKGKQAVLEWMAEIEKRTLPERVAALVDNLQPNEGAKWSTDPVCKMISRALRTGDLSELKKWQRKK